MGYSGRVKQGLTGKEGSKGRWTWSEGSRETKTQDGGATAQKVSLQGTSCPGARWEMCSEEVAAVLRVPEMSSGEERVCFTSPSMEVSLATKFSLLPWLHCHCPPYPLPIWTLDKRMVLGKGKVKGIAKFGLKDRRSLPHLPP